MKTPLATKGRLAGTNRGEGGRMNLTRYEQEVVINLNADEEIELL